MAPWEESSSEPFPGEQVYLMLTLFVLFSCVRGGFDDGPCGRETSPVARDDSTLGFDSYDVFALVSRNIPSAIEWDEITAGAKTASLNLSLEAVADDVSIVTLTGCEPETVLSVPLEVSANVAHGEALATGTLVVLAPSADDLSLVTLDAFSRTLPVVLSGDYASELTAHVAAGAHSGETIEDIWIVGDETWQSAEIDIEVEYATGLETVWRGHWH